MIDLLTLKQFYDSNEDFKTYVDKYMKTYRIIFVDVALKHKLVQEYYEYLKEEMSKKR